MTTKRRERRKEGGNLLSVKCHHQVKAFCSLSLSVKVGFTAFFQDKRLYSFIIFPQGKRQGGGQRVSMCFKIEIRISNAINQP